MWLTAGTALAIPNSIIEVRDAFQDAGEASVNGSGVEKTIAYTRAAISIPAAFIALERPSVRSYQSYPLRQRSVSTHYGPAFQSSSSQAGFALNQVRNGQTVYKGGFINFNNPIGDGPSETIGSQFLSLENPLNPGYAGRYGIPPRNQNFNFVLTGQVEPGAPVVTRPAPGYGPNPGGGIEAVTSPGGFRFNSFYMP
jgi:hypothetical protein